MTFGFTFFSEKVSSCASFKTSSWSGADSENIVDPELSDQMERALLELSLGRESTLCKDSWSKNSLPELIDKGDTL